MSNISKDTLMPIGLVMALVGLAFNLGKSSKDMDTLSNRVVAIENDRVLKIDAFQTFQKDIITRLTRIETKLDESK
jgi:hypothetical protein